MYGTAFSWNRLSIELSNCISPEFPAAFSTPQHVLHDSFLHFLPSHVSAVTFVRISFFVLVRAVVLRTVFFPRRRLGCRACDRIRCRCSCAVSLSRLSRPPNSYFVPICFILTPKSLLNHSSLFNSKFALSAASLRCLYKNSDTNTAVPVRACATWAILSHLKLKSM